MENKELNVLFSSDENYAQHLGVAIVSLLETNQCFELIRIYIIDNKISGCSKEKLNSICENYSNATINWLSFEKWKPRLNLNMTWDISLSSYARLFVADMLPLDIERILYLDCDMIICSSLHELWNENLQGYIMGAVQDTISDVTKKAVGILPNEQYFNAGLLLIDLKKWRTHGIEEKCLTFIEEKKGAVIHHDQGVLNGVFRNRWYRLPLKNNVMTIHFLFDTDWIMRYFDEHAEFYSENQILEATEHPVILHYTPSFTSRPWFKDCKHPRKNLYWMNLVKTPWREVKPESSKDKWYVKLINWIYRVFKI